MICGAVVGVRPRMRSRMDIRERFILQFQRIDLRESHEGVA
jgi:hypothetical protein